MQKMICLAALVFAVPAVSDTPRFPKYPFGLIGLDYSVLSEQDVAINGCIALPEPFSIKSTAYPYWQCFETNEVTVLCDQAEYDESEKTKMVIMAIAVEAKAGYREYLSPRPISLDTCRSYQRDWTRLRQGTIHACLAGQFTENGTSDSGRPMAYWIFNRLKTKRGCISYFDGECSLSRQIRRGCHPR